MAKQRISELYNDRFGDPQNEIWKIPPTSPGEIELFGDSVYARGAMTLQALRNTVGDEMFFKILRAWTQSKKHSNGTTEDFTALAKKVSGRNLDSLFQAWLYGTAKPTL